MPTGRGATAVKNFITGLLLSAPLLFTPAQAMDEVGIDALYSMSLEDLLNLEIRSSTLSVMPISDTPSSIVIITREQIARSPARNIRDLLETYVPGLMFFDDSSNGGNIRIRGLGQRNYNTLLLINGRPVNQKSNQGSVVELNNWDMTDIERIEVAKGPGSVTHGPGAISGVINLITRRAGSIDGLRLGLTYNDNYQSKGVTLDYGHVDDKLQWLAHLSLVRTEGYQGLNIYQLSVNGEHGFKGTEAFSGSDSNTVANFYADADDKPQLKMSIDVDFGEDWRLWSRYTSAGNVGTVTEKDYLDGASATHEFRDQYFIASLENEHQLSPKMQLKSLLSFDSENYYDTNAKQTDRNHDDVLNRRKNFSENEWFARTMLTHQWSPSLSLAAGAEFSYDYLAKPWGESANNFRVGSSRRNFITEDSLYRGDGKKGTIKDADIVEFSDGWSANTYSLMAELDYQLWPGTRGIISARTDNNDFTDSMLSPRVALVSHLGTQNTVKASWQRSLRMNTMIELYIEELEGNRHDPEEIDALELSYSRLHTPNFHTTMTAYHYEAQIIAWSGQKSELVGEQRVTGLEFDLAYQTDDFSLGFNHSYLTLNDWEFTAKTADGSTLQKISVADFLLNRDFLTLSSTGDSLTFWSDNTSKLWADIRLAPQLILHLDARISWKLHYGRDLFAMYDKAYAEVNLDTLSAEQREDYDAGLTNLATYHRAVDDQEPYGRDIRFNAALIWNMPALGGSKLALYGQNLINFNGNTRQKSVNYADVPISSWLQEPRTVWLAWTGEF